jgi:hypothetical protein
MVKISQQELDVLLKITNIFKYLYDDSIGYDTYLQIGHLYLKHKYKKFKRYD